MEVYKWKLRCQAWLNLCIRKCRSNNRCQKWRGFAKEHATGKKGYGSGNKQLPP